MNLEQLLAELRTDPDFAALPAEWQANIAQQVMTEGLGAAVAGQTSWLSGQRPAALTIQNIPQLAPELMAEYNRVAGLGDRRSWEQWAAAHSQVDPSWLTNAQRSFAERSGPVDPGMDALDRWLNKARQNTNLDMDTVPVEQDLMERILDRGYADLDKDAARQAWAQGLVAEYDPLFQQANQTLADLYNGNMLRGEQAASDEMTATRQGALAEQMGTRRAALDEAVRRMYAAQDPLNQARIDAANAEAAGINLAVQGERDRVLADFAQDGYVGGSTGTDAAMARASIGGRQAAAQTMGAARVANATDMAGIGRYEAGEGRTLSDFGAAEKRGIVDEGAGRRLGFFTQDIQRRLDNLTKPQGLFTSRIQMADAADDFGNSGFRRLMGNLSGFSTNGTPPPSFAPYQQPVNDVMGSGLQNLGAGLFGMSGNYLNSYFARQNNKPTTTYGPNGMPTVTSGAGAPSKLPGGVSGANLISNMGLWGCWVAREVYGVDNPRWLIFRHWVSNLAPRWLFNAYVKHGERVARWISDKPSIKAALRRWMDGRVEHVVSLT